MTPSDQLEDKKQHRRLQNRANQRARRLRLREKDSGTKTVNQGPFDITRWRLSGRSTGPPPLWPVASENQRILTQLANMIRAEVAANTRDGEKTCDHALRSAYETLSSTPSPRRDLLLSLIQYNVLRGIFDNKLAIMSLVTYFADSQLRVTFQKDDHPTRAVILPRTREALPPSLLPTELQMTAEHPTWMDTLPFPNMRDNLIKREGGFDPREFAQDLVGDLLDITRHYMPESEKFSGDYLGSGPLQGDDELTTTRNGLIVWGEPYNAGNWEATPGFVRKWRWVMEGCECLIESTNRWRESRGEEPLAGMSAH
ncbi:unnamed protein product [Clonostachys rhizophaga]|uniref:BZIP domain-containing protein n=1 Tax=Clonostachys rhizophaga TaxID=160324 RepID=A0A9N9VJG9_9HYPO|nr:unnamed protein product [Clonostachys rhizophaga]